MTYDTLTILQRQQLNWMDQTEGKRSHSPLINRVSEQPTQPPNLHTCCPMERKFELRYNLFIRIWFVNNCGGNNSQKSLEGIVPCHNNLSPERVRIARDKISKTILVVHSLLLMEPTCLCINQIHVAAIVRHHREKKS